MKLLYLLSLLVFCDGSPLLEAPKNVELSSFRHEKESGFVVNWIGVENGDESDPILGYKMTIWEEDVDFGFELKEDGTLEPKKVGDTPKALFDGAVNVLFELMPNGRFEAMEMHDMLYKVWQKKTKMVYRLNSEGQLMPLKPVDIPELELRHDSSTKETVIDIPATKTQATFKGTKRSHIYEVAVQAYTSKSTGPLSKKAKIVTY